MRVVFLALIGAFAVGTLVGWFVHWLMHQRWSGRLYRSHMTHHLRMYPPKDLLSEVYRDPGGDNGVFVFAPAITVAVLVLGLGLYFCGVSLAALITVAIASILIGAAHDLLHTAFHIRGSKLERFGWFLRLRELHFYHHRRMNRNLGIFWFAWDRLLKTFRRL